ncbi:MAG TPA: hypothetical protein VF743_11120, partial [Acidimicrobiales bacterium]
MVVGQGGEAMNAWGRRGACGAPTALTGGAPAEAGALRVEVVDDVDDLAALAEPWQRLLLSSAGVTAFASPAWVLARFRHLERPGDVYAVTVWRGSRLVGLAPFARTRL